MSVPSGPRIITSRFDVADGHTYAGYVRTGGYRSEEHTSELQSH